MPMKPKKPCKHPGCPRLTEDKYCELHVKLYTKERPNAGERGYYSELIQRNNKWQYVGVYADEAQTGTKDSRTEFQRLITDCRAGKIDMVITKSISRFARNTVTLLEVVRELKLLNEYSGAVYTTCPVIGNLRSVLKETNVPQAETV